MKDGDSLKQKTGQTLGRYKVLKAIGSGGMGNVWLAEDPVLRRQVAIKTLPAHNTDDQEYRQRFLHEAHAAATLNHPHILVVHDYGEQTLPDGHFITYLVMPFVTGGTLSDRITIAAERGTLPPPSESLSYLAQAAEAIDYAHERGIIHRDIKPKNMLLRQDHWLLLADFGIARILTDQEHLTQTGVGIGTPEYMAPEQAQGRAVPGSDLYSLAVVAYQFLTGRLPFTADSAYALTVQHIVSAPPSPRQFNPAISPLLEQTLLQGLAKDPAQRPASAHAFVTALQMALTNEPFPTAIETTRIALSPSREPGSTPPAPLTPTTIDRIPSQTGQVTPSTGKGLRRREVLLGGSAALAVLGSLGIWEVASHLGQAQSKPQQTPPARRSPDEPALILTSHTQPVIALAWSPLTSVLISGGLDANIFRWNIQNIQRGVASMTQPEAGLHNIGGSNVLLAWSPDGSTLAIGDVINADLSKAYVALYQSDLSKTAPGFANPLGFGGNFTATALTWNPGHYLTVAVNPLLAGNPDAESQFSLSASSLGNRIATARPLPITIVGSDNSYAVTTLAYAPDGSRLAAATTSGVVLMNLKLNGTSLDTSILATLPLNGAHAEADAIAWSSDGQRLAALNINRSVSSTLNVWENVTSKQKPTTLSLPETTTTLQTLAWSLRHGSTQLAAGSAQGDGKVYIWDTTGSLAPIRTLHGPGAPITALAWSNDGQWLAAAYSDNQNSIALWNI